MGHETLRMCAAKILAEAPKKRRWNEFLDLMEAIEKYGKDEKLQKITVELKKDSRRNIRHTHIKRQKNGKMRALLVRGKQRAVNKMSKHEAWHK